MKNLIVLLLVYCSTTLSYSQTVISGFIKDENGTLLIGANVYIEGTYDGTSSNDKGFYTFTTYELGKQLLKVDYIGYNSFAQEINLTTHLIHKNIKLTESFNQLNAVTISAGTFEASDKKKSIAITSLDMVTTPSATGDIYGALQTLPGTTTVGESGRLYIKGGDSRESKTFIDGMLVYVPYSSSAPNTAVRGRFNPFMFSGIMFSTGAYSAEYGQALSGILALKTNELRIEDQLNISILTVGVGLSGTKTFEKSSITSSINYNNLTPYMKLVPQYTNWNDEPSSVNGEVSYRLKTKKSGMLKLYGKISQSNLSLFQPNIELLDNQNQYNLTNNNLFINGSWTGELWNNWIVTSGVSFTYNNDNVKLDTAKYNEYLKGGHAKAMVSKKVTDKIKIKFGTELYSKKIMHEFLSFSNSIKQDYTNNTLSGFIETELYTSNNFVARIGGRIEYSNYLYKWNIAPRISTAYKFNNESQISFAYGWFFQDPADDYLLYANSLEYERADHYTLNYQFEKNKRVIRGELFYKEYKNLVKFTDKPFYLPDGYSNMGYGNALGFDIFYRDNKTIKNGEYWISYSYIDSKKNYLDFPETAIPNYINKHNLTFVYKHWVSNLRSKIGISYKMASPRAYNNPNSPIFNGEQTIPYQTLDLNWSFLYRQNIVLYASVSNVPGFKQNFGYNYSTHPNENGIYEKTPIMPGAKRFFLVACFITLSKKGEINQMDKINNSGASPQSMR